MAPVLSRVAILERERCFLIYAEAIQRDWFKFNRIFDVQFHAELKKRLRVLQPKMGGIPRKIPARAQAMELDALHTGFAAKGREHTSITVLHIR